MLFFHISLFILHFLFANIDLNIGYAFSRYFLFVASSSFPVYVIFYLCTYFRSKHIDAIFAVHLQLKALLSTLD